MDNLEATLSSVPDDEYVAPPFTPRSTIENVHGFPRFGHTADIGKAASSNDDIKDDYVQGVVFIATVILLIYISWLIVLLVLKYVGSSKVGCAAGAAPRYPTLEEIRLANSHIVSRSDEDIHKTHSRDKDDVHGEEDHESFLDEESSHPRKKKEATKKAPKDATQDDYIQWEMDTAVLKNRARRMRLLFLVSGLIVLITSIVFIALGLVPLNNAFKESQGYAEDMQELLEKNMQFASGLIGVANEASEVKEGVSESVSSWCNNSIGDNITIPCEAILDPAAISIVDNGNGNCTVLFSSVVTALTESLANLGSFAKFGTANVLDSLTRARDEAAYIESKMSGVSWWYPVSVSVTLLMDVFTLIFISGVFLARKHRAPCFFLKLERFFVMPIFSLVIVLTWFFASGFAVTAVLNADVCTGSPDKNIVAIFGHKEVGMDPFLFQMTTYYVKGCGEEKRPEKPTEYLDSLISFTENAMNASGTFLRATGAVETNALSKACGNNVSSVFDDVQQLQPYLVDVQKSTIPLVQGLYCSNFRPIYMNIMHDAVCHDGIGALIAIFGTLLVVTVFGMIMISLRMAWHQSMKEVKEMVDEEQADAFNEEEHLSEEAELLQRDAPNDSEDAEDAASNISNSYPSSQEEGSGGEETSEIQSARSSKSLMTGKASDVAMGNGENQSVAQDSSNGIEYSA